MTMIDVGPRTSGARVGMVVRERATGKLGEIVEVDEPGRAWSQYRLFVGDVAIEMAHGVRVCGPQPYFWTLFELVEDE